MIKTFLSTGALLSVEGESLITVLDTVVLHVFILCSSGFGGRERERERNSLPILGLLYWSDLLL